jgi:phosphoribosylpyrophosphate synthetase
VKRQTVFLDTVVTVSSLSTDPQAVRLLSIQNMDSRRPCIVFAKKHSKEKARRPIDFAALFAHLNSALLFFYELISYHHLGPCTFFFSPKSDFVNECTEKLISSIIIWRRFPELARFQTRILAIAGIRIMITFLYEHSEQYLQFFEIGGQNCNQKPSLPKIIIRSRDI